MNLISKIIETLILSAIFGTIISGLFITYFKFSERIQLWSESFAPPKNWSRRFLHILFYSIQVGLTLFIILYWISFVTHNVQGSQPPINVIIIVFGAISFLLPVIIFRKHIFRKINMKKIWE